MSDKEKKKEEFLDLADFSKKYEHYIDAADSAAEAEDSTVSEEILEYEDITSYSEGNADFYMQPREEAKDIYISKEATPEYDSVESVEYNDASEANQRVQKKKNKGNFFTRNHCQNIKIIALLLVISILLVFGGGLTYLYIITGRGQYGDPGIDSNSPYTDNYVEDDHDWDIMGSVNASSLNEFLYRWANNGGEKMYSSNVINVLLCGVDSENGNAKDGRADLMMLVSINKKTKTITLVSLLRDSWTYMHLPRSDGSYYDYYFKLNSAYNYGGPTTLLNTIENNYKIEIDQFIAVDFVSFPKLIDALGGVTVDVQDYEANYIRRTSSHKQFPSGRATLNGEQALIYSRIRKCDADSDISRTRRQRAVIKSLVDSAKSASNGQLLNAFKQVSPYLRTGYTQSEVFALIAQAYTNGWMKYNMNEITLPNEDYVDRASTQIDGHWTWITDYASCARKLQLALYGQTNIVLDENRTSVLDFLQVTNPDINQDGLVEGDATSGLGGEDYSEEESTESTGSTRPTLFDPDYTLPDVSIPTITLPSITLRPDDDETTSGTEDSTSSADS